MLALPEALTLLCHLDPEGLQVHAEEQAHLTQQLIQALLKQAVERIARLREVSPPRCCFDCHHAWNNGSSKALHYRCHCQ